MEKVRRDAFANWNRREWAAITRMDLKSHPKIHILNVLDKKFWLSIVKYQNIFHVPDSFNAKKYFLKYFLSYPPIRVHLNTPKPPKTSTNHLQTSSYHILNRFKTYFKLYYHHTRGQKPHYKYLTA